MPLRSSHFAQTLDLLDDPLLILCMPDECLFMNQAFSRLVSEDVTESNLVDCWPSVFQDVLREGEIEGELRISSGESIVLQAVVLPLDGNLKCLRVISTESEEDSFHHQRLETLGMLAGGVAHDFNNVLAGILGHITYMKTILPQQGAHIESLKAVEDGARKASMLTQQILNFSKLETKEKPVQIDLSDLTEGTCRLLRGATGPSCSLQVSLPEKPVAVLAVEGKLAQVIVNLVINARDAVQGEGEIRISLERANDLEDVRRLYGVEELSSASYVRLSVSDDGIGIPEHIIERVFEPYFSTKEGAGTGLGLSLVAAIVKQFGGVIDIQSSENIGTTIAVYLPVVSPVGVGTQSAKGGVTQALLGGSEKILIADDESPVRNVLAMSLEHLGYSVVTVSSGQDALDYFQKVGGKVDLVILDMLMPHLPGEEVFRRLRELDQEIRVLVISGYSSEEAIEQILATGGRGFIQKPFTIEELSIKVRECLDSE